MAQWQDELISLLSTGVAVVPAEVLPVVPVTPSVCNPVSVVAVAVDTQLLPSDGRLGATIYNDSDKTLFVNLGSEVSSYTKFTVALVPNGYFETPFNYSGEIRGIWAAGPIGFARITSVENPV